jgi:uncharacterized CHY-type Zn-finger protein
MAKTEKIVCSGCIKDFDVKEIFIAQVPNREYTTVYCEKCLKKLGIKEYKPYKKPRKNAKKTTTNATKRKTSAKTTKRGRPPKTKK